MMNRESDDRMRQAVNPYLPSYEYIPDGEPHVFGDRVYIFGSHDAFDGTEYCMNDYVCYSASVKDLTAWRYEGVIYKKNQDPRNISGTHCLWAPDVVKGPDGRYYLYYCLDVLPEIGVAVCDTPAGEYQYLGLVRYSDGGILGRCLGDYIQFDPGVFLDEDGKIYLYSGNAPKSAEAADSAVRKASQVMGLQPDMLTIAEGPKRLLPDVTNSAGTEYEGHEFYEASSIRKINGNYYLVYSDVNSTSLCYAVSERPDGEYRFGGVLVDLCDEGIEGWTRKTNFPGNTHGGLECIDGRWYVFYHRQTNHTQYSRQGCAEEIRILEDGSIPQVEVTSCGLNQGPLCGTGLYEARIACNLWAKDGVEFLRHKRSETPYPYFTQDGEDREYDPNQYIANIRDGTVCGFKYFCFEEVHGIAVRVRGTGQGRLLVTVKPYGEVCAELIVKQVRGEWTKWRRYEAEIRLSKGVHALFFEYQGSGSLDFLNFEIW